MKPEDHPLFKANPLTDSVAVSAGDFPVPYHVYQGHGLLVGGTCDAEGLQARFGGQDVFPVLTDSGRGLALLFVCDFTHASHGPHCEVHLTALAAPEPGIRLPDDPAALLAAFGTRPDWGALSLHLWNDAPDVVAYNREFLGLDARLASGDFRQDGKRLRFAFADDMGAPLISGDVSAGRWSDPGMMLGLCRHMGLGGMIRAARQSHATAFVINRKGPVFAENRRARTLTAPDRMVVTRFRETRDRIGMPHPALAGYGFVPTCLEHVSPFRFVYFPPGPPPG